MPIDIAYTSGNWSSGLWTEDEVHRFMADRLTKFMLRTGLARADTTFAVATTATSYTIPDTVLDIRRVAFSATGDTYRVLDRNAHFEQDFGVITWDTIGEPNSYVEHPVQRNRILIAPVTTGTAKVGFVPTPTTQSWRLMTFLYPYIKYGVMADMLSKAGEANDPQRASYCEQRFEDGIEIAKMLIGELR